MKTIVTEFFFSFDRFKQMKEETKAASYVIEKSIQTIYYIISKVVFISKLWIEAEEKGLLMREPASSFALKTRFLSIISKMRIRKNVRLSSFMPAELIKPYDCQLNQSPWDVIDFSDETESNFRQVY